MNIETKFNIGDSVYFFNTDTLRLTLVSIIGISFSHNEDSEPKLLYMLNLMKGFYNDDSGQLLNEVEAYLAGKERGKYVETEERFLFDDPSAFLDNVTSDIPKIVKVENGNT